MNHNEIYFRLPPEDGPFLDVFRFAWDAGVGNHLEDERPIPWTTGALEAAFESRNRDVSIKSIENWRSGKTLPSRKNIILLADIFSGSDRQHREAWLDCLIGSLLTQSPDTNDSLDAKGPETQAHDADVSNTTQIQSGKSAQKKELSKKSIAGLAFCVGALAFVAMSATGTSLSKPFSQKKITDIRFCTDANFDTEIKRCTAHQSNFPKGTALIHVSFESNVPYGQAFSRRWYRDGRLFIEKDGFFDEAWENWTWIRDTTDDGNLPGDYVLRIIIDDKVTTGTFTVDE